MLGAPPDPNGLAVASSVGLDQPLDERMAHHIRIAEAAKGHALHPIQDLCRLNQAAYLASR